MNIMSLHKGLFYDRGKTAQNTDSLKIEYPKISLFRPWPDKWTPAPPVDW